MGKKESANEMGEAFLKGRRAGVEGTHGTARKGVAERTIIGHGDQRDSGSLDPDLAKAASVYKKAVKNGGGKDEMGDQALHDR